MGDDAGTERWMTYDELAAVRGIKRIGAVRLVQRHKWRRQAGNDGLARVLVPHDALASVPRTVTRTSASSDGAGTDAPTDAGTVPAFGREGTGMANALATLREAVTSLTEAFQRAETRADAAVTRADAERARADVAVTRADGLREAITVIEAKLAEAEHVKEAARKRAHELSNRMMVLEAWAERAQEATERAAGLDGLLADTERRLTQAEAGRRTAQERLDTQDRAEVERRGRGRWARLRAAWRGQ